MWKYLSPGFQTAGRRRDRQRRAGKAFDLRSDDYFSFCSSGGSFSNMVGNSKRNKKYFAQKYPHIKIRYKVDPELEAGHYAVVKCSVDGSSDNRRKK